MSSIHHNLGHFSFLNSKFWHSYPFCPGICGRISADLLYNIIYIKDNQQFPFRKQPNQADDANNKQVQKHVREH